MTEISKEKYDKKPLNPFLLSYESLLRSALTVWYYEHCHIPKEEASYYTEKFINDLFEEFEK